MALDYSPRSPVEKSCRTADPDFWRINYEVLGNLWSHLHGHIHPRYLWEPENHRIGPVHLYGRARDAPEHRLDTRHDALRNSIATALREILADNAGSS